MPRLPPRLVHQASKIHYLLPLLLQECRDLQSARNELRWLREHVQANTKVPLRTSQRNAKNHRHPPWQDLLVSNVKRRSRGEPLQYILGSQHVGELELLCKQEVLIPRPETESYTIGVAHLANNILKLKEQVMTKTRPSLRILDLGTGTGVIPLLLASLLDPNSESCPRAPDHPNQSELYLLGIDISPFALALARQSLESNITSGNLPSTARRSVHFAHGDIISLGHALISNPPSSHKGILSTFFGPHPIQYDILVSNPPYISPADFALGGKTTKSVRKYEPQIALVPPTPSTTSSLHPGDTFYPPLLQIAKSISAKIAVLEVGDNEQAYRIVEHAKSVFASSGDGDYSIELWRDDMTRVKDVEFRDGTGYDWWEGNSTSEEEHREEGNSKAGIRTVVVMKNSSNFSF